MLGPTTTTDEVHQLICRGSMCVKLALCPMTSDLHSQEDLMQLNHLNLCVHDLTEACTFFQNNFDLQLLERKKDAIAVMSDEHGFTLVLSNPRAFGYDQELQAYPGGFHIGFIQETSEQVDQAHRRLAAAGIQLSQEPKNMRGSYGFYFTALNDLLIEISCPL
jgi:catechol 2,3-dioxygenase-like lactoylglutathione lyase family enzyme